MNRNPSKKKAFSVTGSTNNSQVEDFRVLKRNLVFIYGLP